MKNKIKDILANTLGLKPKEINNESELFEDFNCDQVEVNDLMSKICFEFKINSADFNFKDIKTVKDIAEFCEENSDEF